MDAVNKEKPRAEQYRPELVRLPRLTLLRRFFRWLVRLVFRLMVWIFTRCTITGLERFPHTGPALVVVNHLGDADAIVAAAYFPGQVDAMAKVELYDFPLVGQVLEAFGVIWIHRGTPDRRALRAVFDGLEENRIIAIAPEGRESITGALEEGTGGAAFIALRAGVPVIPVALTGTENALIYSNLKGLRRTAVTLTVGEPFMLESSGDRKADIEEGTHLIMSKLAEMLPPEYQGIYAGSEDPS